ncbi:ATP-dependent zinc metalloprotease FtsH [Oscillibacter sp.]|jgi:cell division protease FtsH|uniref:ATP-dependent zinc metalloprotease FtsH n=1 Tax=Oscillibacter sp. TaxID=1945593 RepID=UPI00216B6D92|nr:ATP-dependent zinc metalloprotease FtsH [Oscillibacter sp.]MCI9240985.1 ATP-dependent zinc metalloprotease FtsH [Oscillibacter sp.]MCI9299790.1 ATP-dependent zinc metalloprotease FtsH [Oscillibacter sp.]MCI9461367.1 ATP-dependent zinc metalloprotease FtsH [Oscillibacter sp.]
MDQNNNKKKPDQNKNSNWRGFIHLICWAVLLAVLVSYATTYMTSMGHQASSVELEYSEFLDMLDAGKVAGVDFDNSESILIITPADGYVYTNSEGMEYTKSTQEDGSAVYTHVDGEGREMKLSLELFTVRLQSYDAVVERVREASMSLDPAHEEPIRINQDYQPPMSPILLFLVNLAPFFIIILVMSLVMNWMAKKGMGGIGGIGGVGKSNAKVYMEKQTGVTFRDVAGQDEAKESLTEIIDFLHNPGKYTEIGAKLPKGALLVGPPGTGKTLLAKAVAGEANVPFFSISGSDFVEMFVGVGASRVRDLFKEASKVAPCIVFIDEIDTIGKSRDNRMGGNDEREQTLNQLLAEMDGFDPTKGVILLAATNRPEVLDQALLRPGRFDRRITIDRPNLAGRISTLEVHTRNIKLGEDVNLKKVALATAGCVGADLANLVNEAALRAVRKGRKLVSQEDMLAAFELVIAGTEKKGSVLTEFEKKLVAYHEVGHAMVAYKQKNTEPVQKITIVPHTQGSLGYTLLMPEEDKTELRTKEELMAKITVSMGGRAAEEVVMDTMTNGASQDIQDATNVARNMVAMFGMSEEFGMMALASRRNQYLDGGYGMDCAQDTAARMDKAVKVLLDEAYKTAVEVIRENREDMDKVVAYLLEKETITGAEMVAIIEGRDPALVENPYASTRPPEIEPAAKKVHMISEKILAPEEAAEQPPAAEAPEEAPPSGETGEEQA